MAVQKCFYDNLGRCVRTVPDVMHDPPPVESSGFNQLHMAVTYFFVILITAFVFSQLRSRLGVRDDAIGLLTLTLAFLATVYVSMCLAVFALNYGFQKGMFDASVHDTNNNLRIVWEWLNGRR